MIALTALLVLLGIAAWTDIRRHRIANAVTYPGMVAGLLLTSAGLGLTEPGWEGLTASAAGALACGAIMLMAFVLFDLGGGDVKLITMIGAFLGLEAGIEAILWTFSIGFVVGVAMIIWQHGAWRILVRGLEHVRLVLKARGWVPLTPSERRPLERGLFLAPSALAAVVVVVWPHLARWWESAAIF